MPKPRPSVEDAALIKPSIQEAYLQPRPQPDSHCLFFECCSTKTALSTKIPIGCHKKTANILFHFFKSLPSRPGKKKEKGYENPLVSCIGRVCWTRGLKSGCKWAYIPAALFVWIPLHRPRLILSMRAL